MNGNGPYRVIYQDGQYLRLSDLEDEQQYHLTQQRVHNIAHHSWGIVRGLELTPTADGVQLLPGLAVDGYGRELVVAYPERIYGTDFDNRGRDEFDVWLHYDQVAYRSEAPGAANCGRPGPDVGLSDRLAEVPRIELRAPLGRSADRRHPDDVLEGDRDFPSTRVPPDDPARFWPVFLGTISRSLEQGQTVYAVALEGRPYSGLVGAMVLAPSGKAWLQVGGRHGNAPEAFVVTFAKLAPEAGKGPGAPCVSPSPLDAHDKNVRKDVDVLEVTPDHVMLRGSTTVNGDIVIQGGLLELVSGPQRVGAVPPWSLYHDRGSDALRIEIGDNPGDCFRVGTRRNGQFEALFEVGQDGTVEVFGDLVVKARLEALVVPPPNKEILQFFALSLFNDPQRKEFAALLRTLPFNDPINGVLKPLVKDLLDPPPNPELMAVIVDELSNGAQRSAFISALESTQGTPVRTQLFEGLVSSAQHDPLLDKLVAVLADPSQLTDFVAALDAVPGKQTKVNLFSQLVQPTAEAAIMQQFVATLGNAGQLTALVAALAAAQPSLRNAVKQAISLLP